MAKIITRFAPSPTGMLHIGNMRTALINFLFARKHNGQFILRIDDTDPERSQTKYAHAIEEDLRWLGLDWDLSFHQNTRLDRYEQIKQQLLACHRLYPCFETPEELAMKRQFQLSIGKPPIYDRAALSLSPSQIESFLAQGRKPHYRFLLQHEPILWSDLVKGETKYHGANLSDPIIIREDGSMTYMLCSTIDDVDYDISHIIRGEDHVSNTAIQIQMFMTLTTNLPTFGHLSLIKAKEDKISKRFGGFEIANLRDQQHIEPMAVNSFLALIGTSRPVEIYHNLAELINQFDMTIYSKSPTTYIPAELEQLNHKLVISLEYSDITEYLNKNNLHQIDENFWLIVRANLHKLSDLKEWWELCHSSSSTFSPCVFSDVDKNLLQTAATTLPLAINQSTLAEWVQAISAITGKHGKELYMPLRYALMGRATGPELGRFLPLLSRDEILRRLQYADNQA